MKKLLSTVLLAVTFASPFEVKAEDVSYTVTVPDGASFALGRKTGVHYVDFTSVEPSDVTVADGIKTLKYTLTSGIVYNYRTSFPGKLTTAGYFTMNADASKVPALAFKASDYETFSPALINHSVSSNSGFETGDIFVNVNERGHLLLNVGDTFDAHAMRTWQLTNSVISNYFFEPDFHYTVTDTEGNPSETVVSVEQVPGSAWATLKANAAGTAIVTVTYDAINLNAYNSSGKNETFTGTNAWGAVWPENTAVYVVTVGETASVADPNMTINTEYNKETLKLAGSAVDAEHDVFYYLEDEEGASYSFTPANVTTVEIAYPAIGERKATYSGFGSEGVTANADGSYTVLLREGRQIVRLLGTDGKYAYQVLTAKKCTREIVNTTHEGQSYFLPGDKVEIRYSGLRHPANKLAGIYNMSAYPIYKDTPEGTSTVGSRNQYQFGSTPKAQTVTYTIPETYADKELILSRGVIQVTGFGDPIGNHRTIDRQKGRLPNFSAVAHQTYFGHLPDAVLRVGEPGGVSDITSTEAVPVGYYNLQGVMSENPRQGLNIVRYSDGTTRKVFIP